MKRRSKVDGKADGAVRRKAGTPRRPITPKAVPTRRLATPGKETKIAQLTRERDEALQQQRAAADVLKVISRSSVHLERVLDLLVQAVARLCHADHALMFRRRDAVYRLVAARGLSHKAKEFFLANPFASGPGTLAGRVALERRVIHLTDVLRDPKYTHSAPKMSGARTALGIPLLRDDSLIGVFVAARTRVYPFTTKEIELATAFADQAVIAIENARLLNDLQQRTAELDRLVAELQRERNNKLMNIEAITSSIAHEVRQPLAAISANLGAAIELLKMSPPNLHEATVSLNGADEDVRRAVDVLEGIRSLFGRANQPPQAVNMNDIVLEALLSLRGEMEARGIAASHDLTLDLPAVTGHKSQLQEVVFNLVVNALEAMDDAAGRILKLEITTRRDDADQIVVAVKDTGPGIDAKQLDGIFDAFVTTKSKGMGLGLTICRAIAERHGGRLTAYSDGENGALFQFVLPMKPSDEVTDA